MTVAPVLLGGGVGVRETDTDLLAEALEGQTSVMKGTDVG